MTALPRALVDRKTIWNALVAMADTPVALGPGVTGVLSVPSGPVPVPPGALNWHLQTPQGFLALTLLDAPLKDAIEADLTFAELASIPDPLTDMLCDGLVDTVLERLAPEMRRVILGLNRIDPPENPMHPAAGAERLLVTLDFGWPAPVQLMLDAPLAVLTGLAMGALPAVAVPQLPGALAALIPSSFHIALPGPVLNVARLRALGAGDGVMVSETDSLLLLGPGLTAALVRQGLELHVKEIAVTEDATLPPTEPDPEPARSIADVPVTLSFVLETRRSTLAEIQRLCPGAVLPFDAPEAAPGMAVRVLANGREIGTGNLVELDGRKVVRLAQIFNQG